MWDMNIFALKMKTSTAMKVYVFLQNKLILFVYFFFYKE